MWSSSSSISATAAPKRASNRSASATSFPPYAYGIKTTSLTIIAIVLMCLGALYQNDTINVASINNNIGTVKDASLSSVDGPVGKEANNMKADFGIIGFPKTGTSFLLQVLGNHPEVSMPTFETCKLSKFDKKLKKENIFLIAAQQSEDERTPPTRYGFKCPSMIRNTAKLEQFAPISNETRLVVGVRHPVLWFESFYNFRVKMNHELGNWKPNSIPSPLELTGDINYWYGVSVKHARFDIYLKQLAKTSLTEKEMKEMLNHETIWEKRLSPIPNKVFIYTIDQIADRNETRKMIWQKDLHTYLQLKAPFDWSISEKERSSKKKEKATFNETINICDEKYSTIRSELTRQGREASKWIIEKFITSPNVVVSDALFFKSALREWANDPCKGKGKN